MSISKYFPGKSFDNWHGGWALCFAHKIPTQMCTEQILAISGSFACTNCTKYKLLCTKSRQWSACCPVECKPWACNKISNFTRGLTFTINDLHFHAMCILEIFATVSLISYIPYPSKKNCGGTSKHLKFYWTFWVNEKLGISVNVIFCLWLDWYFTTKKGC